MRTPIACLLAVIIAGSNLALGQEKYDASVPEPTLSDVKYGDHPRHVIDFWKAVSDTPTPLVFVIHGGGWQGGSKERVHRFADAIATVLADHGISIASVIHRKPGYDPCELFLTSKAKAFARVAQKKLGFRYKMDVIPLDATLVRGSHGVHPSSPEDGPLVIGPDDPPSDMQDFPNYVQRQLAS